MRQLVPFVELTLVLLVGARKLCAQSPARQAGYRYLSPVPGAPYVPAQTRYVLVRFDQVAPAQVLNLTTDFIAVSGSSSGPNPGTTRLASDGKTVIFTMGNNFISNELVTVTLNPLLQPGTAGSVQPYQYQFSITAPMPGTPRVAAASSRTPVYAQGTTLTELQEAERQQWVRESIARLPDTLRQTLILAYHQDLKYREIAEILKIPVGTVKSRLHAALEKLQQMGRSVRRSGED